MLLFLVSRENEKRVSVVPASLSLSHSLSVFQSLSHCFSSFWWSSLSVIWSLIIANLFTLEHSDQHSVTRFKCLLTDIITRAFGALTLWCCWVILGWEKICFEIKKIAISLVLNSVTFVSVNMWPQKNKQTNEKNTCVRNDHYRKWKGNTKNMKKSFCVCTTYKLATIEKQNTQQCQWRVTL